MNSFSLKVLVFFLHVLKTVSVQTDNAVISVTSTGSSCPPLPPISSSNVVKDPSFEDKDGSWSFASNTMIASDKEDPAHSGTHFMQFTYATLNEGTYYASFAQEISTFHVDSQYTLRGYYAVPIIPENVECTLKMARYSNDVMDIYFMPMSFATTDYQFFTAPYQPIQDTEGIYFEVGCTLGPGVEMLFRIDFDDITIDIDAPPPILSSCPATISSDGTETSSSSTGVFTSNETPTSTEVPTGDIPTVITTSSVSSTLTSSSLASSATDSLLMRLYFEVD